jgi:hypothetical protein
MAYLVDFTANPQDQVAFRFDPPAPPLDDYLDIGRGVTFSPDQVPTRAVATSSHKRLPTIVSINAWWGVSDTFRNMVETREPGVHQFFPIEIVLKGGILPSEPYWIFNIRQRIDAVVVELSRVRWLHHPGTTPVMAAPITLMPGETPFPLVLCRETIGGRHVWRGDTQLRGDVFFSNDLISAYKKAKMRGLRVKYCEEA